MTMINLLTYCSIPILQPSARTVNIWSNGIVHIAQTFGLSPELIVPMNLNHDTTTDLLQYYPARHLATFHTFDTGGDPDEACKI